MHAWSAAIALALALGTAVRAAVLPAAPAPIVVGYYTTWYKNQTAGVDLSKYTHVNIAFASPTTQSGLELLDDISMSDAVSEIHAANAKAIISVGGWTNSGNFSDIVKSDATRATFVKNIAAFLDQYGLDGVDIDWEYPGNPGDTCNVVDKANDTPNLLKLLRELRAALDGAGKCGGARKLITMAVALAPFRVNGEPSKDVSEFARVADYIHLMAYDVNGLWSETTGPNAPLFFEDGKGAASSLAAGIDAWTAAGWPAHKITAGVPFYGRALTATANMLLEPNNQYQNHTAVLPQGDVEDLPATDVCAGTTGVSGQWMYKYLRSEGVLKGPTEAAAPWVRTWDDTTKTPWLFNPQTNTFITYDDAQSIKAKVDYAASKGLAGIMVWALYNDYQNELLDVLHTWGAPTSS